MPSGVISERRGRDIADVKFDDLLEESSLKS